MLACCFKSDVGVTIYMDSGTIVIFVTPYPLPMSDAKLSLSHESVSLTEAVSIAIRRNYVVYEALRIRVANYHKIATQIAPRVQELTGRKAKVGTLVVAVKRFSDGMEEERASRLEGILDDAQVGLTSGVVEISLRARDVPPTKILEEVLKMSPRLSVMPEVIQLPGVVKVVAHREDGLLIEQELGKRFQTSLQDGMARITVRLSRRAEKVIGLAAYIAELLYLNGVVLQSAYIGRPDIMLVVEWRFGPLAYDVLSRRSSAKVGKSSDSGAT
jgi:hypothetical protein